MSFRYLIDENLRGTLLIALTRTATRYGLHLQITQVGDLEAPPLGTSDAELLMWTEQNDRVLISRDARTLPVHLNAHIAAGRHCPGILLARHVSLNELAEYLVMIAFAGEANDIRDQVMFIP